jgi:hypothetical protein
MTPDQFIDFTKKELQKLKFANASEKQATDAMMAIDMKMLLFEKNKTLETVEEEKKTDLITYVENYASLFATNFTKAFREKIADNARWLMDQPKH